MRGAVDETMNGPAFSPPLQGLVLLRLIRTCALAFVRGFLAPPQNVLPPHLRDELGADHDFHRFRLSDGYRDPYRV
ncbi:unnamed protein product [Prunus armeniaca]|uniref:Uncharacterized protein n=1 Tax=Prunus armeniaca TaxID=36596 RepID=A0A6J5TVU6_PRUAR|nr:unnamed protein product [Prunus armeniaca]